MSSKAELRIGLIEKFGRELSNSLGYDTLEAINRLEVEANWAEFISQEQGLDLQEAYTIVSLELLGKLRELDPEPPIPTSKRQQEINSQLMQQFFPNRS